LTPADLLTLHGEAFLRERPKNLVGSEEFKERMPKRIEGKFLYSCGCFEDWL